MKEYYKLTEIEEKCYGRNGDKCKDNKIKECVVSSNLYIFNEQNILKKMKTLDENYAFFYKKLEEGYRRFSDKCFNNKIKPGNRATQEKINTESIKELLDKKINEHITIEEQVTVKTKYGNKRPDFLMSNDKEIKKTMGKKDFHRGKKYYFIEFKGSGQVKDIGDAFIQSVILKNEINTNINYKYSLIVFHSGTNEEIVNRRKELVKNNQIKKYIHSHHAINPAYGVKFAKKELDSLFKEINTFFQEN